MYTVLLKLIDALFLMRLFLLIPAGVAFLVGYCTSKDSVLPGGFLFNKSLSWGDEKLLYISLLAFLLVVAVIYIINQITDIESDRINQKLFILPNKLISINEAWCIAVFYGFCAFLITYLYLPYYFLFIYLFCLVLGLIYDLPITNMKGKPWGGLFFNVLGHGIVTYLAGWFIGHGEGPYRVIHMVPGAISTGFAYGSVYLISTILDEEGDRKTEKKTFAVTFGAITTGRTALILCILSVVSAYFIPWNRWVLLIPSVLSLLCFLVYARYPSEKIVFQVMRLPVAFLTLFVIWFVPLFGLFMVSIIVISRIYYKKRFNFLYPTFKNQ